MAARTITLQNLLADVRYVGDHEGATLRHTDERITRALNQSIQAFRLMISERRHPYYIRNATGTISGGSDTIVPFPTDCIRIFGIDVFIVNEWRELFEFSMSERGSYGGIGSTATTGVPSAYRVMAASQGNMAIEVIPVADTSYTARLWYMDNAGDMAASFNADGSLATSSATFDGVAGWEDWIVYDTCLRMTTRDAAVTDNFELLQAELARIQARILQAIGPVRDQPAHRIDTRGRRQLVDAVNRWRWWW